MAVVVAAMSAMGCQYLPVDIVPEDKVPEFNIPGARPPRPALPADQAALLYPKEPVARDPFLTLKEQAKLDGMLLPVETPPPDPNALDPRPVVWVPRPPKEPSVFNGVVNNIILGPPNRFQYNDTWYEEGDSMRERGTVWVVQSISESGVRVRSQDGRATSFLKFKREPFSIFEFGKN